MIESFNGDETRNSDGTFKYLNVSRMDQLRVGADSPSSIYYKLSQENGGGSYSYSSSGGGSSGIGFFYFFFVFIPKLVFYYMPIKHFFKFFLAVTFAAVAYGLTSEFGEGMRGDIQRTMTLQRVDTKSAEYYGISPKYLNQYRKLSAKSLADRAKGKFNDSQEAAYYAVIKERVFADPTFFDVLKSSDNMDDKFFAWNTCSQAHNYFYAVSKKYKTLSDEQLFDLYMEQGNFYFYGVCASSMPASQFVNEAFLLKHSKKYSAEYNRIFNDPRYILTNNHNAKDISYMLYALALILFIVIYFKSLRLDEQDRMAEKLAKQEAEKAKAEKDAAEESKTTVTAKT